MENVVCALGGFTAGVLVGVWFILRDQAIKASMHRHPAGGTGEDWRDSIEFRPEWKGEER